MTVDAARAPWTKADIVNHLAAVHGYRTYLELCTATSGFLFRHIDRSRLATCHRLMYRCPHDFDDGMAIDFRSGGRDIAVCIAEIRERGLRYDLILVDPFHEYAESYRDLQGAFDLLNEDGTMVVHDCLPPDATLAQPYYVEGPWCGVTYKAFLDFVVGRGDLRYCTVDADFGCGIIRKGGGRTDAGDAAAHRLAHDWRSIGDDFAAAFRLFEQNQRSLLRLVSVDEFVRQA